MNKQGGVIAPLEEKRGFAMRYPGSNGRHLITQIKKQGAKITLTDHSEWQVAETDQPKLKGWWTFEEVMVRPTGEDRYVLFHTRRQEAVEAARIQ